MGWNESIQQAERQRYEKTLTTKYNQSPVRMYALVQLGDHGGDHTWDYEERYWEFGDYNMHGVSIWYHDGDFSCAGSYGDKELPKLRVWIMYVYEDGSEEEGEYARFNGSHYDLAEDGTPHLNFNKNDHHKDVSVWEAGWKSIG